MNDSRSDNCKDMRELLSAYRDAELDANERPVVEAHLNSCSDCREELAAVESVVKSLKSLPAVTLSRDFSADIESLIKKSEAETAKQAKGEEKVVSISRKKPVVWISAAAAIVMLMVATYLGTTSGGVPVVANKDAATQEKTTAKDAASETPEAAAQEKPLIADSDVRPNASVDVPSKVIAPHESIASIEKHPVAVESNRTVKEVTPRVSNPVVATAVKNSAPKPITVMSVDELTDNQALVAFSDPNDDSDYDSLGISTDEDGLYAIKM